MSDILLICITVLFFAVCILYAAFCEKDITHDGNYCRHHRSCTYRLSACIDHQAGNVLTGELLCVCVTG